MAKNKFIWGIIIVLALILIVPNFMKKEAVPPQLIFGDSLAQCNSYRSEDYACSECKLITQDMVNCDSTLNYYLNKYAFIKVEQIPLICSHLVNYKWAQCITGGGGTPPIECANGNTASCTVYIGMGEISCPGVKTCANEIWGTCAKNDANCGTPTCNTPADTNCDGIIITSELITFINKWTSGTETTSNLINVINAWSGNQQCIPNCSGKECGNDGCGGSCGTCQSGYSCNNNQCDINNNANKYLIITKSLIMPYITRLVDYRNQEYQVQILDVNSMTQEQIKGVIQSNKENLKFILIVGQSIPPNGEYDTDEYYTDLNNDGLKDVPIGRILSENQEEINNLIDKIITFESTQYYLEKNILLIAGEEGIPPSGWQPATYFRNEFIPSIPEWNVDTVFCGCGYPECGGYDTQSIYDGINNGQLIVEFEGHGGNCWYAGGCGQGLVCYAEPLTNINKYPIAIAMSCSTTNYLNPSNYFSTRLLMAKQKGVVMYIGSKSTTSQMHNFNNLLFKHIKTERTIGEALLKTRRECQAIYDYYSKGCDPSECKFCNTALISQFEILGDPALRIN